MNPSHDFAHALNRGLPMGLTQQQQQQQMQQQQQQQQQQGQMNNMNFTPAASQQNLGFAPGMQANSGQLSQQQAAQQQHQQQLAAASLHQRMQSQQQQQQQGGPQPNFQSVSQQNQQRMNVGGSGLQPGGMQQRQAIGMGGNPPQQSLNPQRSPLSSLQQPSLSSSSNPLQFSSAANPPLSAANPSALQMLEAQRSGQGGGFGGQQGGGMDIMQSMMKQQQREQMQQQQQQHAAGGGYSMGLGLNGQSHPSDDPHALSRFDMSSDFPALDMTAGSGGKAMALGLGGGATVGQTTLAGQLALNQSGAHNQSAQDSSFLIQNEDFPALGGGSAGARRTAPAASPTSAALGSGMTAASLLQQRAVGGNGAGAIGQTTPAGSTANNSGAPSLSQQSASAQPRPGMPRSAKATTCDKYGLTGLLSVIRMTDPDLNTLALGTDLTTLGLNLNSSEVLYATFASPCLDVPTRSEPDFVLPFCYYMQPPALKTSHLAKFTLETLFYIFYNMPKDTLQVYAAKELYKREWRYHKELKLWFSRAANAVSPATAGADGAKKDASGKDSKDAKDLQSAIAAAGGDANTYLYFDINSWERRIFRETHILQPNKFMTEEELTAL